MPRQKPIIKKSFVVVQIQIYTVLYRRLCSMNIMLKHYIIIATFYLLEIKITRNKTISYNNFLWFSKSLFTSLKLASSFHKSLVVAHCCMVFSVLKYILLYHPTKIMVPYPHYALYFISCQISSSCPWSINFGAWWLCQMLSKPWLDLFLSHEEITSRCRQFLRSSTTCSACTCPVSPFFKKK